MLSGLIAAHHHTLLLLALPLAIVIAALHFRRSWPVTPGLALESLGAFAVGLLPLAWIPIAAAHDPPFSWGDVHGSRDFLRLLLRADYGTFRLDPAAAGHDSGVNHGWLYLQSLGTDLGWAGVALLIAGFIALARRPALLAAVAGFGLLQALFFTRVHFPLDPPVFRGVVERFYVLPDLVLALVAGLGAWLLLSRFPSRARSVSAIALVAALAAIPVASHGARVSQRGNRFVEHLARDVLAGVPERGVLFVRGDLIHNALACAQRFGGVRRDVTVVDQELLTYDWFVRALRRRDPDLLPPFDRYSGLPGTLNVLWIDHLLPARPVAFLGFKEDSWKARYAMTPSGYVQVASPKGAEPGVAARAAQALDLLAAFHLDEVFSTHDPWSFERGERARIAGFVQRATALLTQRSTVSMGVDHAGLARLGAVLERAELEPSPEPALLHAAGALRLLHPRFRDLARARADLRRWLDGGARGPEADQAREWLVLLERPEVWTPAGAPR